MTKTPPPKPEDYIVVDGSDGPRRDFRISVGLREGWDAEGRVFDVSEAVRTARAWMRRRVEAGEPALSGMFTRAEVTYAWPREDGTVGAKFSDQVKLDLEKDDWKEFSKTPFRYENQFDAAPGAYKMTVVLSAGSDTYGKSTWPLKIDDYDGKQLALGGIAMTNSVQRIDDLAVNADLDSVLLDFNNGRAAQKRKYRGEMFIADGTFLEFFQREKFTGLPKGIVGVNLLQ